MSTEKSKKVDNLQSIYQTLKAKQSLLIVKKGENKEFSLPSFVSSELFDKTEYLNRKRDTELTESQKSWCDGIPENDRKVYLSLEYQGQFDTCMFFLSNLKGLNTDKEHFFNVVDNNIIFKPKILLGYIDGKPTFKKA